MITAAKHLARFLLLAAYVIGTSLAAAPLKIGLVHHAQYGEAFAEEWRWALRGGGADFQAFEETRLHDLDAGISLLVIDNTPLGAAAAQAVSRWVEKGGLLIVAGAEAALQAVSPAGKVELQQNFLMSELLGADFVGFDPGLSGAYPAMTANSPLLSPLQAGDALRFGENGLGHSVRVQARDAKVLAEAQHLNPGPDGNYLSVATPTILSKPWGKGQVVFLSFSPAAIAHCYPDVDKALAARDCSGAAQARALMRWLPANLLWEARKLQLPLLWEAPGDRPHAVALTGDVHNRPSEVTAAVKMGKIFNRLELPLSLYLVGEISVTHRDAFQTLKSLEDVEISPHSADGEVYWTRRFKLNRSLGILRDFQRAQQLLGVEKYPGARSSLISVRNESWTSDQNAWGMMAREGAGLVFDFTADAIKNTGLYLAPRSWFRGGEEKRLFLPLFERSVSTPVANFRLRGELETQLALLASAQAEPCCIPLSYQVYSDYVMRWHRVFDRLSRVGGLTEVWLWHPGGVASKGGFDYMTNSLRQMQQSDRVRFFRSDVLATWRYNREQHRVDVARQADGQIQTMRLLPAKQAIKPLPDGAPSEAATTSYWVLGKLTVPGWKTREWVDQAGRSVTVLVHPVGEVK